MNPRLLLLEDDPIGAGFLREALTPTGLALDHATTLAAADRLASEDHALWLFDLNLPDGLAVDLLDALRARGLAAPAIALTADDSAATAAWLRTRGFVAVLAKPIEAGTLRAALAPHLPQPRWDEAAALAALGGRPETVARLRQLFLAELPTQAAAIEAALHAGEDDAARAQLHRLKGACGFVGAAALAQAARALSLAPADPSTRAAFVARVAELSGATPPGADAAASGPGPRGERHAG